MLADGLPIAAPERLAWPVLASPSRRPVARSSSQLVSTPSSISLRRAPAIPSPSNGREARPRGRSGSSVIVIPAREHVLAQAVLEEAAAGGDGVAADGAGQMTQEAGGGAGRVDDRHAGGRHLARADPAGGALPGLPADALRRGQIAAVGGLAVLVVALHGGAVPARTVAPRPWRVRRNEPRKPLLAARLTRPLDQDAEPPSELVMPGTARAASSAAAAAAWRLSSVGSPVSARSRSGQFVASWSGSASPTQGSSRQQPGGGHRVLGQGAQGGAVGPGRGRGGDTAADDHPQADLARVLALELLQRTQPPGQV